MNSGPHICEVSHLSGTGGRFLLSTGAAVSLGQTTVGFGGSWNPDCGLVLQQCKHLPFLLRSYPEHHCKTVLLKQSNEKCHSNVSLLTLGIEKADVLVILGHHISWFLYQSRRKQELLLMCECAYLVHVEARGQLQLASRRVSH